MIDWFIAQVQTLFTDKSQNGAYCDLDAYYEHQFAAQKSSMAKPRKKSASEYLQQFR